jgi:carbonic anhydrase
MILDEVLEYNRKYTASHTMTHVAYPPKKEVAVITCMDARLVDFLEPVLGLERGDALWIKSAGGTAIDDRGDVIRSVVIAIHALGVREVLVVGHTNCGMARFDLVKITQEMRTLGVARERLPIADIGAWLGIFADEKQNVRDVVKKLRSHPLIPAGVLIHGLLVDVESGELQIVERGG